MKKKTRQLDCEEYFNDELIKEITSIYEKERIINTANKRILSLSKDYQENIFLLEKSEERYDEVKETITLVSDTLKKKKKQKIKDIIKAIISYIVSFSLLGITLVGPFFIKTKKVKTIKTVTNSTTLDWKKQEEEYLPEDDNCIYLEMYDPWEEEDYGYSRDIYKFSLPYEEYKDKELEELLDYKFLTPLVMDIENAEKNTETSLQLDYEQLYIDTFYELIKIEQIPEDFIYIRSIKDQLPVILLAFLINFKIHKRVILEYKEFLDDDYEEFLLLPNILSTSFWLKNQKEKAWSKEEITEYEVLMNELIKKEDELEKRMAYLLSTNEEIKMRYERMIKEPALKDILNNFAKKECYELDSINTSLDSSDGMKKILKKN